MFCFFFLMIRRPPRSTLSSSSAASDVYKRQALAKLCLLPKSSPHDILIMEFVFQEETLHNSVMQRAQDASLEQLGLLSFMYKLRRLIKISTYRLQILLTF